MIIRKLKKTDIENGFLETLNSLRNVNLTLKQAYAIYEKRKPFIETYVALENEVVIGTVSLVFEYKFLYDGVIAAHLEDLAVHENYQSAGIGSALMDYCIKSARENGCYKLILNCTKEMKKYYKRFGLKKSNLQMRLDLL